MQVSSCLHREWKDGLKLIEDQIYKVIAEFEISAKEWTAFRLKQKQEADAKKEKERLRLEFEALQAKEITEFEELLNKASRWHKANNPRNYIDEFEKFSLAVGGSIQELSTWLEWVRAKADWYDPFVEREDEVMREVDRDMLAVKGKSQKP